MELRIALSPSQAVLDSLQAEVDKAFAKASREYLASEAFSTAVAESVGEAVNCALDAVEVDYKPLARYLQKSIKDILGGDQRGK